MVPVVKSTSEVPAGNEAESVSSLTEKILPGLPRPERDGDGSEKVDGAVGDDESGVLSGSEDIRPARSESSCGKFLRFHEDGFPQLRICQHLPAIRPGDCSDTRSAPGFFPGFFPGGFPGGFSDAYQSRPVGRDKREMADSLFEAQLAPHHGGKRAGVAEIPRSDILRAETYVIGTGKHMEHGRHTQRIQFREKEVCIEIRRRKNRLKQ